MQVSRPTDASCAASSADTPKRLRRHGSAPYANNIRMASTWPPRAASISGVVPDVAGSSTLARDSSSSTTASTRPLNDAAHSGVCAVSGAW